jgi:Cdc6-like AAA superfamily ATPase
LKKTEPDIIIIRGAPGTGKSTTAKYLSRYFPKGVRIEVDSLRSMVISVDWTNQPEHINILELSTRLVLDFLKLGFSPVIIVDTFSGDKIIKYLQDLYQLDQNINIRIFGLFTTEAELNRRIGLRSDGAFKDLKISLSINEEVPRLKSNEELQVDTTGLSPIETAKIIYDLIVTD